MARRPGSNRHLQCVTCHRDWIVTDVAGLRHPSTCPTCDKNMLAWILAGKKPLTGKIDVRKL